MRYYVVSDVHGFYTELIYTLTEKGFFEDKEPHKLILCGDALDRGEETVKTQNFLLDLLHKDELIFIRGNHEDLMLELATALKACKNLDWFYYRNNHHWANGTVYSAMQLCGIEDITVDSEFKALTDPKRFAKDILESPFCTELIPASVNYFETEHYVFVHGWIPCYEYYDDDYKACFKRHPKWRKASKFDWRNARWTNGIEAAASGLTLRGKTIVCGHIATSYGHRRHLNKEKHDPEINSVYYNKGIIALDATTAVSGKVNCIVIED